MKLLDPTTLVKITGLFFIFQGLCAVVYLSSFLLSFLAISFFLSHFSLTTNRYGMVRYRAVTFHVEHGQYPVDATGPMIFMGAAVCGGVLALVIAIGVMAM